MKCLVKVANCLAHSLRLLEKIESLVHIVALCCVHGRTDGHTHHGVTT